MSSAFCSACGAEIQNDAEYCPECGSPQTEDGMSTEDASAEDGRTLAAITHILGFLTWVIGPLLVILLVDDPFVVRNAKNALMWQVMVMVYGIISAILIVVVIGIFMLILLGILDLVFCIIAAIKASEGDTWQYPLTPSV